MKRFKNLFNKVLIFLLFSSIAGCGGFNIAAGLKFKGSVDSKSYAGNPSFT